MERFFVNCCIIENPEYKTILKKFDHQFMKNIITTCTHIIK